MQASILLLLLRCSMSEAGTLQASDVSVSRRLVGAGIRADGWIRKKDTRHRPWMTCSQAHAQNSQILFRKKSRFLSKDKSNSLRDHQRNRIRQQLATLRGIRFQRFLPLKQHRLALEGQGVRWTYTGTPYHRQGSQEQKAHRGCQETP